MLPSEALYPYTAKEARERGELELWRANFRTNCACAGAIELAIRKGFDGMHLSTDCAKSVIDQYGYKRVGFVLANTLQEQSYDGRYHETNKQWSRSGLRPRRWRTQAYLPHKQPSRRAGRIRQRIPGRSWQSCTLFGAEHCEPNSGEQDFTGRVLILSPDTLRESYWQPENSCGCPEAALAVGLTPVDARYSAPVWETVRPRGGTALSSWALSVTSVSLTGQRKNWPSCGTA